MNNYKFRAWKDGVMYQDILVSSTGWITKDGKIGAPHFKETPCMQSTGLKDKNGVEIYEDDICNDGSRVVFLGGRYVLMYLDGKFEDLIGDEDEVIGNIYQNPELLNNN